MNGLSSPELLVPEVGWQFSNEFLTLQNNQET